MVSNRKADVGALGADKRSLVKRVLRFEGVEMTLVGRPERIEALVGALKHAGYGEEPGVEASKTS